MAEPLIQKPGARFFIRVILPGILAFFLFAALILGYLIPGFEKAMMERKQEAIRELTATAWSILDHYHRLETAGEISRDEAMSLAKDAVKELRYGEESKDYFWITDRHPVMIMHPYRPELNGQDLTEFRDPHGKAMFVEFVRVANLQGAGFVDYMWQWKDDSLRIVPKLSYVRLFDPWGWIVGTGIYIEDVRIEIQRMETRAVLISGGIGLLIIILLIIITRQSHRIDLRRRRAEQELLESRERYKALAEAASEGVLIWSEQGIHVNKTLLSWLGFPERELIAMRPADLIPDGGLSRFSTPEDMYNELSVRMYSDCTLIGKNGEMKPVHADFSRILISGDRAVMMVARPLQVSHDSAALPFDQRLMDRVGVGFFRSTYGRKSKFLSANACLLNLLGFYQTGELAQESVDSFFMDNDEHRLYMEMLESCGEIMGLPVKIRTASGKLLRAILSMVTRTDIPGEKWYEGTLEVLSPFLAPDLIPAGELNNENLAVRAATGEFPGITHFENLMDAWSLFPENIIDRISHAQTTEEIQAGFDSGARLAGSLVEGGADPLLIVGFISRISDTITQRVVTLLLAESGPAPTEFAVLHLGSAGRGEQTFATDQDNALIYADVPADQAREVHDFFLALGARMNDRLAEIGYTRCKGEVMAGNPRWCQPLLKWKDYFLKWTRNPGPEELLEMSIFFDFTCVAGNRELADSLRAFIVSDLRTNDIYFHHMAVAWKPFAPGKHVDDPSGINLKKLLMPLTGMVRLYAMRHDETDPSTIGKCIGLYQRGIFSREILTGTIQAWKTLMRIRLTSQYRESREGKEPDNRLDTTLIGPEMNYLLEKAVREIDNLMLMAANDFHTHQNL